ncbi:MAG: GIY-YIG nuclease family protein [Bacteroidota bacterium]
MESGGPFAKSNMYYVYIIESESDTRWYIGYSENLETRIADHNNNRSKYTRNKGPWKLIFKMSFVQKTEALKFERKLKKLKNKNYIKSNFLEYFIEV